MLFISGPGTTNSQWKQNHFEYFLRKSHVIKTIILSLNKGLMQNSGNPDKPRVLIQAPTGVAAIKINEETVHSRGFSHRISGGCFVRQN